MANPGRAGTVSGYKSHGPERRADAGHPHPAALGGSPMVRQPFAEPKAMSKPQTFSAKEEFRRFGRAARTVRIASRVLQAAQKPRGGGGTTWTATVHPSSGGGGSGGGGNALPPGPGMPYNKGWTPHARQQGSAPSYGGAAYNGGGGGLANAMSATVGSTSPPAVRGGPYKALPAPSYPGERVSNKPPTTQRQSRAGRDRRAAHFKATHNGPKIIQGTAEDA